MTRDQRSVQMTRVPACCWHPEFAGVARMLEQLERNATMAAPDARAQRRRPGRLEYTNPHLIKLLRAAPKVEAPPAPPEALYRSPREADSLAAARGIGASSIVGAMTWAGALMGLWFLVHP